MAMRLEGLNVVLGILREVVLFAFCVFVVVDMLNLKMLGDSCLRAFFVTNGDLAGPH